MRRSLAASSDLVAVSSVRVVARFALAVSSRLRIAARLSLTVCTRVLHEIRRERRSPLADAVSAPAELAPVLTRSTLAKTTAIATLAIIGLMGRALS